MTKEIQAYNPEANDEFDLEIDVPYPAWLWNSYSRVRTEVTQADVATPMMETTCAVLAYLVVWVLASASASACVITLTAIFRESGF